MDFSPYSLPGGDFPLAAGAAQAAQSGSGSGQNVPLTEQKEGFCRKKADFSDASR
jgi:hypothetical protein